MGIDVGYFVYVLQDKFAKYISTTLFILHIILSTWSTWPVRVIMLFKHINLIDNQVVHCVMSENVDMACIETWAMRLGKSKVGKKPTLIENFLASG